MQPSRLQLLGRKFSWNTLVAAGKPSGVLLAIIPVAATVRVLAQTFGLEFTLPVRPVLLIVGTLIVAGAWGLVRVLVPATIAATQDRTALMKRGGLPHLLAVMEADLGAYAQALPERDVLLTLNALLPSGPLSPRDADNLGVLLGALRTSKQVRLDAAMASSNALFAHVRKGWQVFLGTLLLVGYGMLTISYGIAVWQLLA